MEGKNLIVEARFARGRQERLPELVADVIRQEADVLVVVSTRTALAARKMNPIVLASVFDPVAAGIVPSLARPGGNITGSAIGVGGGFAGKVGGATQGSRARHCTRRGAQPSQVIVHVWPLGDVASNAASSS